MNGSKTKAGLIFHGRRCDGAVQEHARQNIQLDVSDLQAENGWHDESGDDEAPQERWQRFHWFRLGTLAGPRMA